MNLKNVLLLACSALLFNAQGVKAAEIKDLTAGTLKTTASGIDKTETSLKLSGTINATDFSYIQDNFIDLQELDLSEAKITGYTGERLPYTGLSNSPEATLPPYSLTGLASLSVVKLPADLKAIGKGAMSGTAITSIELPSSLESIGDYAFLRCNELKKITIPSSIKSIGERAFANCRNLTEVNIADNTKLDKIPEGMFEASGIKNLSLKSLANCTEIGPWALAECNGLTTLVLPEDTRIIGMGALAGNKSIQVLSLPSSTDYIADFAMANMLGMNTLIASEVNDVPYLGENVWRNVSQKDVTLVTPDDLTDAFRDTEQWQEFKIISESQSSIDEVSGVNKHGGIKVRREGKSLTVITDEPLGRVSVFNIKGHLVAAANTPHNHTTFNTSAWTPGIYLIVCEGGVAKVSIKP